MYVHTIQGHLDQPEGSNCSQDGRTDDRLGVVVHIQRHIQVQLFSIIWWRSRGQPHLRIYVNIMQKTSQCYSDNFSGNSLACLLHSPSLYKSIIIEWHKKWPAKLTLAQQPWHVISQKSTQQNNLPIIWTFCAMCALQAKSFKRWLYGLQTSI